MFRLQLHPTPFGLLFGLAVIGFWALLWLWFFTQLPVPGRTAQPAGAAAIEMAQVIR